MHLDKVNEDSFFFFNVDPVHRLQYEHCQKFWTGGNHGSLGVSLGEAIQSRDYHTRL